LGGINLKDEERREKPITIVETGFGPIDVDIEGGLSLERGGGALSILKKGAPGRKTGGLSLPERKIQP